MSTYIGKRVSYPCSVCRTQFTLSKKSKELPNGDVICPKCVAPMTPTTTEEKKRTTKNDEVDILDYVGDQDAHNLNKKIFSDPPQEPDQTIAQGIEEFSRKFTTGETDDIDGRTNYVLDDEANLEDMIKFIRKFSLTLAQSVREEEREKMETAITEAEPKDRKEKKLVRYMDIKTREYNSSVPGYNQSKSDYKSNLLALVRGKK